MSKRTGLIISILGLVGSVIFDGYYIPHFIAIAICGAGIVGAMGYIKKK